MLSKILKQQRLVVIGILLSILLAVPQFLLLVHSPLGFYETDHSHMQHSHEDASDAKHLSGHNGHDHTHHVQELSESIVADIALPLASTTLFPRYRVACPPFLHSPPHRPPRSRFHA